MLFWETLVNGLLYIFFLWIAILILYSPVIYCYRSGLSRNHQRSIGCIFVDIILHFCLLRNLGPIIGTQSLTLLEIAVFKPFLYTLGGPVIIMTYLDHVGPKVLALSIEHKEVKTLQVSIEKTWDPISMDTKLGSFQPYFGGRCSQFDLRICCQMAWLEKPPN